MKRIMIMALAALTLAIGNAKAGDKTAHPAKHRSVEAIDHDVNRVTSLTDQMLYLADQKAKNGTWTAEQCVNYKRQVLAQARQDLERLKAELEAQRPKNYKPDAYDNLIEQLNR